jgi:hypothetical protein
VWPKGLIKKRLEGAISRTMSLHCGEFTPKRLAFGHFSRAIRCGSATSTGYSSMFSNVTSQLCQEGSVKGALGKMGLDVENAKRTKTFTK